MLVSSTSMKAPRATTTAITQGLYLGRQLSWSSVSGALLIGDTRRYNVHGGPKPPVPVLTSVKHNLYQDPRPAAPSHFPAEQTEEEHARFRPSSIVRSSSSFRTTFWNTKVFPELSSDV